MQLTAILPHGMVLVERPCCDDAFGESYVVRDERLGHGSAALKIARVLKGGEEGELWLKAMMERLQMLTGLLLNHVSLPSESWELADGTLVIVRKRHTSPLSTRIGVERGARLSPDRLDGIIGQLLSGLAALHAHKLVHGDVRPENIFLDEVTGLPPAVWLANAEVGTFAWLSQGALRDPKARDYFPLHWHGQAREPSFAADLFALGLTIREMAAGREANFVRGRHAARTDESDDVVTPLPRNVLSPTARRLVDQLLAAPDNQMFADAKAALDWWRRHEERPRRWYRWLVWSTAASSLLLVMLFTWLLWRQGTLQSALSENVKLQHEREDLQRQLLESQTKEHLDKRLQTIDGGLENLALIRQQIGQLLAKDDPSTQTSTIPSRPPTADELASQAREKALALWKKEGPTVAKDSGRAVAKVALDYDDLTKFKRSVEDVHAKQEDSRVKNYLNEWLGSVGGILRVPHAGLWLDNDAEARKAAAKVVQEPTLKHADLCTDRLKALNAAAELWKQWADNNSLTLNDVKSRELPSLPDGEMTRILKTWVLEISSQTTGTIRFLTETNTKDWGLDRYIYVEGDGNAPFLQTWPAATGEHSFPSSAKVSFAWPKEGQFRIVNSSGKLASRLGGYANICQWTFRGPFPVWQAHYTGNIGSDDENLQFTIVNCPGPPIAFPGFDPSASILPLGAASGSAATPPNK